MLATDLCVKQQQKHKKIQTKVVLNITFPLTKQMANINK